MTSPPEMAKKVDIERGSPEGELRGGRFEYFGWVYHLGVNKIGHEFCRLRFLYIRGSLLLMYKRDPHDNPGIVCTALSLFALNSLLITHYLVRICSLLVNF